MKTYVSIPVVSIAHVTGSLKLKTGLTVLIEFKKGRQAIKLQLLPNAPGICYMLK